MSTIRRFEDLIAWQKARMLTREVYTITRGGSFAKDLPLISQIRRASVSIMSNIAEGFERTGKGEFPHFLSTAKASCGEVRSHLYVALDAGYLSQESFCEMQTLAEDVAKLISKLRSSVMERRAETTTV